MMFVEDLTGNYFFLQTFNLSLEMKNKCLLPTSGDLVWRHGLFTCMSQMILFLGLLGFDNLVGGSLVSLNNCEINYYLKYYVTLIIQNIL